MIPRIPDNCERFKIDNGVAKFLDGNIWANVSLRMRSGRQSGSAANLCNAARCAWLDEAEKVLPKNGRYWSGYCHFRLDYEVKRNNYVLNWPYPRCQKWEIDYAHCLAWAEAWKREAKG